MIKYLLIIGLLVGPELMGCNESADRDWDAGAQTDDDGGGDDGGDGGDAPLDAASHGDSDADGDVDGGVGTGDPEVILFVNAHPDDEGIFFGGSLPYYAQVQQVRTMLLSMTSGDWHRLPDVREAELIDACGVYFGRNVTSSIGLPANPDADLFFPRFKDAPAANLDAGWDWWADGVEGNGDSAAGRQLAIDTVATYLRTLRPTVVATHDFDGEYGHVNHQATAIVVAEAVDLAADTGYDDGHEAWQVRKLYIHQSGTDGNPVGSEGREFASWLFHDGFEEVTIDTDGDGSPDMTPRQVTNEGLRKHASQQTSVTNPFTASTVYEVGESYDGYHSEWWGLYQSTAGADAPAEPFVVEGTEYSGWARGDFF